MKRNGVRTHRRLVSSEELEVRRLLSAIVADASFESPALGTNSYAYNPGGSPWTFGSTSGVVNSPSSLGAPTAPDGMQVAFLQTNRGAAQYSNGEDGTISQSISLPSTGYYSLSVDAAADASDVGAAHAAEESFMVTLDGTPVLTGLHPANTAFSSIGGTFYAGAGTHTFALVSTGPDSTTTFIDQVQLTSIVPGAAAQVVILTVPQSLATGVASSAITLQLEDSSGLAVDAGSGGVIVNLSSTSNQGVFRNGGGVLATAVTIPSGSSTITFTYRDGLAGTPTLTASASGLTAATQQESVLSVTSSSFLQTSGTNIVNGSGQTVQLRGVNLGSWLVMEGWMSPLDSSGLPDEYGVIQTLDNRFGVAEEQNLLSTYQQNWITVQDLQNIKSDGFNVIRVPVWWADFETLQGQWRSDAFAELDWLVNTAGSMGIYTIIDMHGVVGGQSTSDDTGQANLNNYWTSSYDQQQTNLVMENIALHYKNNPMVAGYDLMNEPDNAPSDSAVIAAYDRLYSAVRSVDTNHIAFIEGTFDQWNWSMLPSPASQGWSDVVYEMHEYQWGDTNNPSGVEAGTNNQVSDFQNHYGYDVPDYVGEFNDFGTGSSPWQYTFQQYDNNNISWSFWSYKATDGTASSQDSWGLYDPVHTLSAPNIQTASTSTISSRWSNVTTAGSFAINTMLQSALVGAGVSTPVGVAADAAANPNPVTGTSAALSVLGSENGSGAGLTYTWSATGPASVTYSGNTNGTNAAQNITANFTQAGSYVFTATIADASNNSTTSQVAVTVQQTPTGVIVTPSSATVAPGGMQQFSASATDQFGDAINSPTFNWSITGAGNLIDSTGMATPGSTPGTYTVTAALGSASGMAQLTAAAVPTVAGFQVNDGNAQRSMVDSLTVTFNEPVTLLSNAITLNMLSQTGRSPTPMTFTLNSPDGGTTWVLTFTDPSYIGGSLPDGAYELIVSASGVTSAEGDLTMAADQDFEFIRLYGDFNGDGAVNSVDFGTFAAAFGHSTNSGDWYLDYDNNGVINSVDFGSFAANFGHSMSIPSISMPSVTLLAAGTSTSVVAPAPAATFAAATAPVTAPMDTATATASPTSAVLTDSSNPPNHHKPRHGRR
jgi:endoglucanase